MHKGIVLTINEHLSGALHILFFVAYEHACGQDRGHPIFAQPTLRGVLAKRAAPAGFFDMRQLGHGSEVRGCSVHVLYR